MWKFAQDGMKWPQTVISLILLGMVAAAGYAAWSWHADHLRWVPALLPLLALLACPLMHLFMGHGHGKHHGHTGYGRQRMRKRQPARSKSPFDIRQRGGDPRPRPTHNSWGGPPPSSSPNETPNRE